MAKDAAAKGTTPTEARAQGAKTLSDVKEREWTDSIGTALVGLSIMLGGMALFYFVKFWLGSSPILLESTRIALGLGIFAGAGILGLAILRGLEARKAPSVSFPCPYCDQPNLFVETPTEDFDCEHCNRTVHFQNGAPIPVRTIVCQACRTEHRVAINVQRYVCDRCNRPLQISTDPTQKIAKAGTSENDALLQNYNVLLMAIDRRHENEIAFKLQDLLLVNMKEARRLMKTASTDTPLVVGHDLPQRKAEAIRRELQDLGATVTLRASTGATTAPRQS